MVCSGAGFPMHCDLYVVYCTSPVNFLAVVIPSRCDGTARPTYQRTAEPSPGGGIEDYVGREMSTILLRGPLGTWGSLTCSKSTTRVKRLKVPPGGLPPSGLNPRHSGHKVGTLPLDHGGRLRDIYATIQELEVSSVRFMRNHTAYACPATVGEMTTPHSLEAQRTASTKWANPGS
jgi:hypothetical protein